MRSLCPTRAGVSSRATDAAAALVNLRACGAAFLQQIAAISKSKALPHVPDDHGPGLPSTGSVCAGHGTTRGEAIPGENDGKIIERVKEKTRQIPKRTPHASLRLTRNGAAPETRVRSSILRRAARTTQASPHSPSTLIETYSMSTPQEDPAQVVRGLVALTRKRIIGQDAAVEVFALEAYSHIALGPLQRRPGVFLIAGPNVEEDHLDLIGGLVQSLKSMGGLYKLAGTPGEDIDHIFSSSPGATEGHSLLQALKDNPHGVFVLQDIDQAHPNLRTRLERIWSHGYIIDEAGKLCALADADFHPDHRGGSGRNR